MSDREKAHGNGAKRGENIKDIPCVSGLINMRGWYMEKGNIPAYSGFASRLPLKNGRTQKDMKPLMLMVARFSSGYP